MHPEKTSPNGSICTPLHPLCFLTKLKECESKCVPDSSSEELSGSDLQSTYPPRYCTLVLIDGPCARLLAEQEEAVHPITGPQHYCVWDHCSQHWLPLLQLASASDGPRLVQEPTCCDQDLHHSPPNSPDIQYVRLNDNKVPTTLHGGYTKDIQDKKAP